MDDKKYKYLLILLLTNVLIKNVYSRSLDSQNKKKEVQEINFDEMDLKGIIRNPDGSFIVQKKKIKFIPLFEITRSLDEKIRKSNILGD